MFISIGVTRVRDIDFDSSELVVFVYDGQDFNSLSDLLVAFDDNDTAECVWLAIKNWYVNRFGRDGEELEISDIEATDPYELEFALENVLKTTGVKISLCGVTDISSFLGLYANIVDTPICDKGEVIQLPDAHTITL